MTFPSLTLRSLILWGFLMWLPMRAQDPIARTPENVPPPELPLLARFDQNGDHRLDRTERDAARAHLAAQPSAASPASPEPASQLEPVKPGPTLSPGQVDNLAGEDLFNTKKIRTLFLSFAEPDWEKELTDFARTDVQVPARVEVDGQVLQGVGISFPAHTRASAGIPGYKRDLRLTLDFTETGRQLAGRTRLELLAAESDPTFLRTWLYHQIGKNFGPAPAVNFVRVVINGENWGIYANREPLDDVFIRKKFGPTVRPFWIAGPGANLSYLGDDPAPYRSLYHLETPEDPAAWARLIKLCKVLKETPADELALTLSVMLDIDSTVRFLALQNALINHDGYGGPTGSYGLYLDPHGRIHLIPRDAEHSFRLPQVTEVTKRPGRGGIAGPRREPRTDNREVLPPTRPPPTAEQEAALLKPYLERNESKFPKQSRTDLALLLSHSFLTKADYNHDDKATAEEWRSFAGSWFVVMDEDFAGRLTHAQFIAKLRVIVTPASVIDGKSTQTYGGDDPAAAIGRDFLAVMDANHDGYIKRDEVVAAFDRWYGEWTGPKSAGLTQPDLQKGFGSLFSQSVFAADQAFVDKRKLQTSAEASARPGEQGGRGSEGPRGGPGGNNGGLSVGPLRLGLPKKGDRETAPVRTEFIFREQLDPLDGKQDPTRPLLARMLSIPHWRSQYRTQLGKIADDWLLWSRLGPLAKEQHDLIAAEVRQETHRPFSYARFVKEFDLEVAADSASDDEDQSLKEFVKARRSYLMKEAE